MGKRGRLGGTIEAAALCVCTLVGLPALVCVFADWGYWLGATYALVAIPIVMFWSGKRVGQVRKWRFLLPLALLFPVLYFGPKIGVIYRAKSAWGGRTEVPLDFLTSAAINFAFLALFFTCGLLWDIHKRVKCG